MFTDSFSSGSVFLGRAVAIVAGMMSLAYMVGLV